MRSGLTTNTIRLRLRDAHGRLIETLEESPEVAARRAGDFVRTMGSDPDSNGAEAMSGTIEFEPVGFNRLSPAYPVGLAVIADVDSAGSPPCIRPT